MGTLVTVSCCHCVRFCFYFNFHTIRRSSLTKYCVSSESFKFQMIRKISCYDCMENNCFVKKKLFHDWVWLLWSSEVFRESAGRNENVEKRLWTNWIHSLKAICEVASDLSFHVKIVKIQWKCEKSWSSQVLIISGCGKSQAVGSSFKGNPLYTVCTHLWMQQIAKHCDWFMLQSTVIGSAEGGKGQSKTSVNKHKERKNGIKHTHTACATNIATHWTAPVSVCVFVRLRSWLVTVRSLSYGLD